MRLDGQKNLVLILARELASKLATPMFIADADGKVVFYNDAAEKVLGRKYEEGFDISAQEWTDLLKPTDLDGRPLGLEDVPPGRALLHRRPAHTSLRMTGLDNVARQVSVTALPLMAHADDFVGMLAIFWQEDPQTGDVQ